MNEKLIKFLATGFGSGLVAFCSRNYGHVGRCFDLPALLALPWPMRLLIVIALSAFSIYVAGAGGKNLSKKR